ncbi:hypothetical protein [Chelatococcus sp. GCM10030263]|uniref:hypothetical protein n=1 Tax=Chelatococcus sp. GCM10030263 TaxID=3273387 RepID=UPI00366AF76E
MGAAVALAACMPFAEGFVGLPESAGWEALPVQDWLVDGLVPDKMSICQRPDCPHDAVVARFTVDGDVDGGLEALRRRLLEGFGTGQSGADRGKKPGSTIVVRKLAAGQTGGMEVTMRSKADPARSVVAVLAERPSGGKTELVLSIALTEAVAKENAFAALGTSTAGAAAR